MGRERYVVLGLARARAEWFRSVGQWATSAVIPAEFVKCVSDEEVRARLDSGRPFSALLVDGVLPGTDRDLVAVARDAGCAVVVVDDGGRSRDWFDLGAVAVLPPGFGREQLLDVLATHARMIGAADHVPVRHEAAAADAMVDPGQVAVVIGPGGTGASTVAIALAQGLAADTGEQQPRSVLLADLRRHAEQAMLHDTRDIVPGIQELVDTHRGRLPSREAVRELTFDVSARGYRLLLGLRRPRYWTTLRPRALEAAFASLGRGFDVVVCDVDRDLEGEGDSGSIDIEERNLLTRTAVGRADIVIAVGAPGMKGVYSLVRVVEELIGHGVAPTSVVLVVNRAPRRPRLRAGISAALAELTVGLPGGERLAAPVFLPDRKVEAALRDGVAIPDPLPELLVAAYLAARERRSGADAAERFEPAPAPTRVRPGSLGVFHAHEEPGR